MIGTTIKLLDAVTNAAAVGHFTRLVGRRSELVTEMVRREIMDRYTGQVLGSLWAIGLPLLLMGVYVFAFLVLFRGRMPGGNDSALDYAIFILAGLGPWIAVQEALGRAPTAVSGNANLVNMRYTTSATSSAANATCWSIGRDGGATADEWGVRSPRHCQLPRQSFPEQIRADALVRENCQPGAARVRLCLQRSAGFWAKFSQSCRS